MKITVFGATGKVGRLVVNQALARGHYVTAFAHSSPLAPQANLVVIKGDVYSRADVQKAITGSGAVLSALSSWGTSKKDVLTVAMQHIIPAMQEQNIRRIISLTGGDAEAPGDTHGLLHKLSRPLLKIAAAKILLDGERHIQLLADSTLDWTVVRSPVMTNLGNLSRFELNLTQPAPWATIHRQSVATAMLDQLEANTFQCKAPFISRT